MILLVFRLVYLPDGQLPLQVPHWMHGSMSRLASFSVFDISDGFILFTKADPVIRARLINPLLLIPYTT